MYISTLNNIELFFIVISLVLVIFDFDYFDYIELLTIYILFFALFLLSMLSNNSNDNDIFLIIQL